MHDRIKGGQNDNQVNCNSGDTKNYLIGIMISGLVEGLKIKMIRKDGLSFFTKGESCKEKVKCSRK